MDETEVIEITEAHIHEVMDRSYMLCANVDDFLLEHSAVKVDPDFKGLAEAAHKALFDLYQLAGKKLVEETFVTKG